MHENASLLGRLALGAIPSSKVFYLTDRRVSAALHYHTLCPSSDETCRCGEPNTFGHAEICPAFETFTTARHEKTKKAMISLLKSSPTSRSIENLESLTPPISSNLFEPTSGSRPTEGSPSTMSLSSLSPPRRLASRQDRLERPSLPRTLPFCRWGCAKLSIQSQGWEEGDGEVMRWVCKVRRTSFFALLLSSLLVFFLSLSHLVHVYPLHLYYPFPPLLSTSTSTPSPSRFARATLSPSAGTYPSGQPLLPRYLYLLSYFS
jgi:hypothetical protein